MCLNTRIIGIVGENPCIFEESPHAFIIPGPFSGSTVGQPAAFTGCGYGSASMFFITLQPGDQVLVGHSSEGFESKQAVMFGDSCPTAYSVGNGAYCAEAGIRSATVKRTNTGSVARNLWYVVQGLYDYNYDSGDYTLSWAITSAAERHRAEVFATAECYAAATNLSAFASPFSASTTGKPASFSGCGAGPAFMFFARLQPGESISVGQSSNSFDSKHAVQWGEHLGW